MNIIETTDISIQHKQSIYQLWNSEYPESISYHTLADFDTYLDNLVDKRHFMLVSDENRILGWGMTFARENEKWFAMILDASVHNQGYGTKLLNCLKATETMLNGWAIDHDKAVKSNGEIYNSPIAFYLKNDFSICADKRLETEKLSAVRIVWTPNERP